MELNATLALTLLGVGVIFLIFAVLFAVKKEGACHFIAGLNSMTKAQQARCDRAAIARDYAKLFAGWTAGAFLFSVLSWRWGVVPFVLAFALLLLTTAPHMHLWAENAFRKYLIEENDRTEQ